VSTDPGAEGKARVRSVAIARGHSTRGNIAGGNGARGPTLSTALEHLVVGSQAVITERIDLALLDGKELLSRNLQRAALGGLCIIVGAAAWFALAACIAQLIGADATSVGRVAIFAALNGGAAVVFGTLAVRRGRAPALVGRGSSATA
jgi:hypothetical protein